MIALLHGRVAEAWHFNAMFLMLLPLAMWFGMECYRRAMSVREFAWPKVPTAVTYGLLAAVCVFGILRNVG